MENTTVDELAQFLRQYSNNCLSHKRAKFIIDIASDNGDMYNHDETKCFLIKNYVSVLKFKVSEIERIDERLKELIDSLGLKLDTLHGINFITTAQLVAEIGNINRFKNARKLAKYSAVAPITYSSGSKEKNFKNQQGNRRLRTIFFYLAIRQIQLTRTTKEPRNPMMYEYYQKKLHQGKTKTQALVCI